MAKILIVDDRYVNRQYLVSLLGYSEHTLLEASNGQQALELVRTEHPDLVITDIVMPLKDGYEFAIELRNEPGIADIPIIFFTSTFLEPQAEALAKAAGVRYAISKPADPELILSTVARALGDEPVESAPLAMGKQPQLSPVEDISLLAETVIEEGRILQQAGARMEVLVELGTRLAAERDPSRLLHNFCSAARKIVGARFTAVGLVNHGDHLDPFTASGVDIEAVAALSPPSVHSGIVQQILTQNKSMRSSDLSIFEVDSGMSGVLKDNVTGISFLGVPVVAHSNVYGVLYVLQKLGAPEFSDEDEQILQMLAAQFGITYENAKLYEELQTRAADLEKENIERRRAEKDRDESRERYRLLAEAARDYIFILNTNGCVEYLNNFAAKRFGITPTEAIGRHLSEMFPVDIASKRLHILKETVSQGEPHYDESLLHFQGEDSWQSTWLIPLKDENGVIDRVMGISRDITRQKKVEEALRGSEERFRQMADTIQEVFWMTDPATSRMLYISPAYETVWGRSCRSLYENPASFLDAVHSDDRERVLATMTDKVRQGRFDMEYRIIRPDGSVRWIWDQAFPILDEREVLSRVTGIARDITSRKKMEAELQAERDFNTALVDTVATLVLVIDKHAKIVRFNETCEESTGYSFEEVRGKNPVEFLVPPEERAPAYELLANIANGKKQSTYETHWITRSGEKRLIAWSITALLDDDGEVEFIIGAGTDITEHRKMEAALRHSHQELEKRVLERTAELVESGKRLEAELIEKERTSLALTEAQQMLELVMNNIPQAIFWKDRKSVYLGCNFRLALDAGYNSPQDVIGATDFDMPWKEQASLYQADDAYVMDNNQPKLFIEEPLDRADGSRRWLRTSKLPLHNKQGEVIGVLGSYEDVTAQKEAETEIVQARIAADEANRSKSEFLSRMSHELRTPLNAILGFGQILELETLSEDANEAVEHILKGGRHLLELINEILDIARIEAGRFSISPEAVDAEKTIRAVLDMMRPVAVKRNLKLTCELNDKKYFVFADSQRFKQVLINIVSNAIKYNRDDGEVVISFRGEKVHSHKRLGIAVTDTGPGLRQDEISKLFIPFERLGAEQSDTEGTGIGLVLSKCLMEAMDGSIHVESNIGQGSTFWIELPIVHNPVTDAQAEMRETPTVLPAAEHDMRQVLYIEDNLSNLRVIEMLLERIPNTQLTTAMQGSLGLELAQQHKPDLILLDLHLPDMMGSEVLRRLQEEPMTRDIPVVVLSADATPSQIERLLSAGARRYLTKPLDIREFLSVLDEYLT